MNHVDLHSPGRAFALPRSVSGRDDLLSASYVIVGHHDVDCRAVLAAVQASVLRTDRSAAAGLDRVCAQRTREHLRDGQAETFQG